MVTVPTRGRCRLGSGDQAGGPRLRLLDPTDDQAPAAGHEVRQHRTDECDRGRAESDHRQAGTGRPLCAGHRDAQRDCVAQLLRLPPRRGHRPDPEPVSARSIPPVASGARTPQPDGRWARERVGRYRPKVPRRVPRAIPDQRFNELFAALPSNQDRALVAFWISTGVRASDLRGCSSATSIRVSS